MQTFVELIWNYPEATLVTVEVNNVSASFAPNTADIVVMMDGITIRVIDVIAVKQFLSQFIVEITFVAVDPFVTVTCRDSIDSATTIITVDSEFSIIYDYAWEYDCSLNFD